MHWSFVNQRFSKGHSTRSKEEHKSANSTIKVKSNKEQTDKVGFYFFVSLTQIPIKYREIFLKKHFANKNNYGNIN